MKVLLVEPVKGDYPPLGLMKVSTYHKNNGDEVRFQQGFNYWMNYNPDLVYITSLFTWQFREVVSCIKQYNRKFVNAEIRVGGILASLIPGKIEEATGIKPHVGVLDEVDNLPPDYSLFPDDDRSILFTSRGCPIGCPWCLTENNYVMTFGGIKKISDVRIGDFVYTHRGNFMEVINISRRSYFGEFVSVRPFKNNMPIECTADHRIPVVRGGEEIDVRAKNLMSGDLLKVSIPSENGIESIQISNYVERSGYTRIGIPSEIKDLESFCRLLGYYAAEGHIFRYKDRKDSYQIMFSLNKDEVEISDDIVNIINRLFGVEARINITRTCRQISIGSKTIAKLILSLIGTGSERKFIHPDIIGLRDECLCEFIRGYFLGDGSLVHSKDGYWRVSSSSRSMSLSVSVYLMLLRLGYSPRFTCEKRKDGYIEGRFVKGGISYCINMGSIDDVKPLAYRIFGRVVNTPSGKLTNIEKNDFVDKVERSGNITRKSVELGKSFHHYYLWRDKNQNKNTFRRYRNYVLIPIRSVKKFTKTDVVYNMEVEGDHTYLANGILVHNCAVWRMEGKAVKTIPDWKKHIDQSKPKIVIQDNNILAAPKSHFMEVVDHLASLGKEIDFNGGFDVQVMQEWQIKELSRLKIVPIRLAFDEMGEEEKFKRGIEMVTKNMKGGITVYVLYNFNDSPEDFYHRLEVISSFGSNITIFPMKFQPLNTLEKGEFIGEHWSRDMIMNMNTLRNGNFIHGVIRIDNNEHLRRVFGNSGSEFKEIISSDELVKKVKYNNNSKMKPKAHVLPTISDRKCDFCGSAMKCTITPTLFDYKCTNCGAVKGIYRGA